MRLPPGFVDYDRGLARVVATRLELQDMVDLFLGPKCEDPRTGLAEVGVPATGGRGGARRLVLPGGRAVYVRQYRRGGLMRLLWKDLYLRRPERPLIELVATEVARAAGCPVPTVLAVCVQEAGLFYRAWIVTEEVDGARDFIEAYRDSDTERRRRLLRDVGVQVRALESAGVYHADLNGHNVLVDDGGRITFIDFDRAYVDRPGQTERSRGVMQRFLRSLTKLCQALAVEAEPDALRLLESGYREAAPDRSA